MTARPLLAFDTSAAHCAAALLSGERIVAERFEPMPRGQAERLIPMLEELLAEAGCAWPDLGAVGVGTGPGNFTGIRIAVAAARGLALARAIPAIGVTGFDVLRAAAAIGEPLLVSLPGPRGTAYVQAFDSEGRPGAALQVDPSAPPDDLAPPGVAVMGDAADALAAIVPQARAVPPPNVAIAPAIGRIAVRCLAAGVAIPRPAPLYVRPPDAAPARAMTAP